MGRCSMEYNRYREGSFSWLRFVDILQLCMQRLFSPECDQLPKLVRYLSRLLSGMFSNTPLFPMKPNTQDHICQEVHKQKTGTPNRVIWPIPPLSPTWNCFPNEVLPLE